MGKLASTRMAATLVLTMLLLLALAGCQSAMRPGEKTVQDIEAATFSFLQEGTTTREEVVDHLGPPTYAGCHGSVYAYRMQLYTGVSSIMAPPEDWSRKLSSQVVNASIKVQSSLDAPLYGDPMSPGAMMSWWNAPAYEAVFVFDEQAVLRRYRIFSPALGVLP